MRSSSSSRRSRRRAYRAGADIALGLDAAATEFFKDGKYEMEGEKKEFDGAGMAKYLADLVDSFPIVTIEDGMAEDDFEGWKASQRQPWRPEIQIVGDDLFVTNPERVQMGIEQGLANAVLIKVNQIGTLSETLETVEMTHKAGWRCRLLASLGRDRGFDHRRSGGGHQCGQIKTGSLSRTDRMAKYNQLIRIEEELGPVAQFAGENALRRAR